MTTRSSKVRYFRKLLEDFEHAIREHELKGSRPPDEFEDIEQYYQSTKKKIINYCGKNFTTFMDR